MTPQNQNNKDHRIRLNDRELTILVAACQRLEESSALHQPDAGPYRQAIITLRTRLHNLGRVRRGKDA